MTRIVKVLGAVVAVVLVLSLSVFGVATLKANARLRQRFETHRLAASLPDAADAAARERGRHLVVARYGCNVCHGENLAGGVMIDDPAIGRLYGPNLTRGKGGHTANYSMADWDRIVRHGVKPDGSVAVMPSEDFFKMSDAELSDIVAYVRGVTPVDAEVAAPSFGPVGKLLVALGKFPLSAELRQARATSHPSQPPVTADNAEFGAHLAATCTTCHRANLAGGPMPFGPPDWPAAANLTRDASGLGAWSYEDFERAITEGISKDGHTLRDPMTSVVPAAKAMLPTERRAIWTYLRSLPPAVTNR